MSVDKSVLAMMQECAGSLSGHFTRQEILSWFRRHYPAVPESTVGAYVQALTTNAKNRVQNHPFLGSREPIFERVGHGTYRAYQGTCGDAVKPAEPSQQLERPGPSLSRPALEERAANTDWFWEGNVQGRVVSHLAATSVLIVRVADTRSREHGTDIEGVLDGTKIHVEVKGWPSDKYADPARAAEPKRTPAALQARVWFADGVLHVLRLRAAHPTDRVVLALPDMGTYRRLVDSIRPPLENERITVLWVADDGHIADDVHPLAP